MKPEWKDAPPWAKWLAMDNNGDWWWYENEPVKNPTDNEWWNAIPGEGEVEMASAPLHNLNWEESKEKRS